MAPAGIEEHLDVTCDGKPLELTEVEVPAAGRVHIGDPPPGELTVDYTATIRGTAQRPTVTDADRVTYLRPSRYAESDRLAPIAHAEFAGISGGADLLAAVSSWTGSQLYYVPGSSGPTGGAVADTPFLSAYGGAADLLETEVTAVIDGQLPGDNVHALVSLS